MFFARIWVLLSMALFRLWPLLGMWLYARHHAIPNSAWTAALGVTVALMAIAQLSAARCSSARLSHARGLLLIGISMSTGWLLLDALLVPATLTIVLLASLVLALLPRAAGRYLGLVHWVAVHRMQP
jgi:hypothetical protein